MAEVLKRWNGSAWVPVAAVNRIEIGGGSEIIDLLVGEVKPVAGIIDLVEFEMIIGVATKIE